MLRAVLDGEFPWSVECSDAMAFMAGLPDMSVDLVLTDPAYESMEKHRARGTTTRLKHSAASSNDWFGVFPNQMFPAFFAEVYRVTKRDRHCYVQCDDDTSFVIQPIGVAAGLRYCNELIWDKKAIGTGWRWRMRTEKFLMFEKGSRQMNNLGWSNVLEFSRLKGSRFEPSEKPEELYERIILNSTVEGDLVVDPFCGSAAVCRAALKHGRRFAGGDIDPKRCMRAIDRIAG